MATIVNPENRPQMATVRSGVMKAEVFDPNYKGEVIVHELKYDDLLLQLDTCELYCASQHIHLGYKEFEIMKHLMSHPEMITSKDDLIVSVWGSESDAMDNNVEVYISFLRKKLKFLKSKVSIKVIRKVGYRLEVCDA